MTKSIKIFLASSAELVNDRTAFKQFIYDKTVLWKSKNIFFELIIWEDFLDSMSETRKQDDYNLAIKECDIFVLLFFTKVGKYTEEEFDIAYQQFKSAGKPLIFTYFKDAPINSGEIDERVLTMLNFKKRLSGLEHFYSVYKTSEGLQLHFSKQLDILEQKKFFSGEEIDLDWLNTYLSKVKDNFAQHMLPQEKITDESAEKARIRSVELLVQERKQAKLPEQEKPEDQVKQVFPFSELIRQQNTRFLIFGDGGGGKTTSLLKLASDVANRIPSDPSLPIPVFIKLNNFDTTERSFNSLLKLASDATNLEQHKFEAIWRNGAPKFLFLLDGYNEVGDAFQEACTLALRQFVEVETHFYMITSRTIGRAEQLRTQLDRFALFDLIRLEENQIKDFLARHNAAQLYEQMGDQLKGLAQNPFMLWALIQSSAGVAAEKLPTNIGQLYQRFIDQYIFVEREQNKVPSHTEYNYSLVKKPVLADLAMKMNSEGITKIIENQELRKYLWEKLKKLQTENEGLVDFKPYEFMPSSPSAQGFLNETVHNDVLRRVGDSLEFMHQSVQDYFTATAIAGIPDTPMTALPFDEMIKLIPTIRSRFLNLEYYQLVPVIEHLDLGHFSEPLIFLAGILDNVDEFLLQLNSRNWLQAAKCAGAANKISNETKRKLVQTWLKNLRKGNINLKWLGCLCVGYSKLWDQEVLDILISFIIDINGPSVLRKKAAEIITEIGHQDHVEYIEFIVDKALSDQEHGILNWGEVLNSINSPKVIKKLFDNWRDTTKGAACRERAFKLLGHLGSNKFEEFASVFLEVTDEVLSQIIDESIQINLEDIHRKSYEYSYILKALNTEKVISQLFERYSQPNQTDDYYEKILSFLCDLNEKSVKDKLGLIIQKSMSDGDIGRVSTAKDFLGKFSPKNDFFDYPSHQLTVQRYIESRNQYLILLKERGLNGILNQIQTLPYLDLKGGDFVKSHIIDELVQSLREISDQEKVWRSLDELYNISKDEIRQITLKVMAELVSDPQAFRDILKKAIKDENPKVRIESIKFLHKLKYQDIDETLLEIAVTDDIEEVRETAVYLLRFREGDEILRFFIELLQENENKRQEYAIFALGVLLDETASEPLERLFKQTNNPIIKIRTADALNKIGNYENSSFLIEGLWSLVDNSNEVDIIKKAASVLLKIPDGDKMVYSPIQDMLKAGAFNEVLQRVGELVLILPEDANIYIWRGIAYHGLNRFEEGLTELSYAEELLSYNAPTDLYFFRAKVLNELNRYDEALVDARLAAIRQSDRADTQELWGRLAYKARHYEESIYASTWALKLDKHRANASFNLGLALLDSGQQIKARDAYDQGIKICEGLDVDKALVSLSGALGDMDGLVGVGARTHLKSSVEECKDMLLKALLKLHKGS